MSRKPDLNLLRVQKFRKKAGQTRVEILTDTELKARFLAVPGASHTERLRRLLEEWERINPPPIVLPPLELTPEYANLKIRIKNALDNKHNVNHRVDPARTARKNWREKSSYRQTLIELADFVKLPQLALCFEQGWGPYLFEREAKMLLDAEPLEACLLLSLIWSNHDLNDELLNPWKNYLAPGRAEFLRERLWHHL